MEKIKQHFKSKKIRIAVGAFIALGIILFIFQIGVLIGYKKAFFSCKLGENYYKGFEGRGNQGMNFSNLDPEKNLPNSNGAVGPIVKIALPSIVVTDKDGVEKTIGVTDDTIFRQSKNEITAADLKIGDFVVVVGNPDNTGNIEARLVRVLPPPPTQNKNTSGQSTTSLIIK
ncbi:MAG: hypothetical protein WCF92_00640 [bacterium]